MPSLKNSPQGFQVDQRVAIALDALDQTEKETVEELLVDRDHFVAAIASPTKVERISRSRPVYALRILSGLNIIYEVSGDQIAVLDLMAQSTLLRYGAKKKRLSPKTAKKTSKPRNDQ